MNRSTSRNERRSKIVLLNVRGQAKVARQGPRLVMSMRGVDEEIKSKMDGQSTPSCQGRNGRWGWVCMGIREGRAREGRGERNCKERQDKEPELIVELTPKSSRGG